MNILIQFKNLKIKIYQYFKELRSR